MAAILIAEVTKEQKIRDETPRNALSLLVSKKKSEFLVGRKKMLIYVNFKFYIHLILNPLRKRSPRAKMEGNAVFLSCTK